MGSSLMLGSGTDLTDLGWSGRVRHGSSGCAAFCEGFGTRVVAEWWRCEACRWRYSNVCLGVSHLILESKMVFGSRRCEGENRTTQSSEEAHCWRQKGNTRLPVIWEKPCEEEFSRGRRRDREDNRWRRSPNIVLMHITWPLKCKQHRAGVFSVL